VVPVASAAVPGILNPVVLMMKTRDGGRLVPYSFGHKWKDGSLRTDIPIQALNLYFNVNFTIVSQANPHVNFFFFSSRGSVGQPVTHRRGGGWRGGYLGSAAEQYLKLDLNKWLRVLRHLELLPRPLGQDWSQLWLQQFGGNATVWPQAVLSDFWNILSDPDPQRLAHMLHEGRQSAFPKLKFVRNRLKIERLVERGRRLTRAHYGHARALARAAGPGPGPSLGLDLDLDGVDGLRAAAPMLGSLAGAGSVGTGTGTGTSTCTSTETETEITDGEVDTERERESDGVAVESDDLDEEAMGRGGGARGLGVGKAVGEVVMEDGDPRMNRGLSAST